MTREEFEYLRTPQARQLIERHLEDDVLRTALKIGNATVVTQIKNLQKCRAKLSSYYAAQCIIPTVSYQQSSSEATASLRSESGTLAVDLTCGLGVDSVALSRNFKRVIAIEIDELRANIARYNFALLGCDNVEVVCSSAQEYIDTMSHADLIYVDPSRRDENGRSIYAVQQCQPDVLGMLDKLRLKSTKTIIKLSPLFDVSECYTLFSDAAKCEVVTLNNECKEVLVELGSVKNCDLQVTALRAGNIYVYEFTKEQIGLRTCQCEQMEPQYICVPDVGFYKSRTIAAMMTGQAYHFEGGYVFTEQAPENFCGAVHRIKKLMPYNPKELHRKYPKAIVHLRDFPYTAAQAGIKQGGSTHLFFTQFKDSKCVIEVEYTDL